MSAEDRVREYVRQRSLARPGGKVKGIDAEAVSGVFFDEDAGMAELTLSDLEELLAELSRLRLEVFSWRNS